MKKINRNPVIVVVAALVPLLALGTIIAFGGTTQAEQLAQNAPGQVVPMTPLGTGFTFQGKLLNGGNPANGQYDFIFTLYDAVTGGNQVGSPFNLPNQAVNQGLFNVTLDFGATVFQGQRRWLLIAVRPAGAGLYTDLAPRQELSAVPYAMSLMPGATLIGDTWGYDAPLLAITNTNGVSVYGQGYVALLGVAKPNGGQYGVEGVANSHIGAAGVHGSSTVGTGVKGASIEGHGVWGQTTSGNSAVAGVYGEATGLNGNGTGVRGFSLNGTGVWGQSTCCAGVTASSTSGPGLSATSAINYGVTGSSLGSNSSGVYGHATNGNAAKGVYGDSTDGFGVYGAALGTVGWGVYGEGGSSGYAGYFQGRVHVNGTLSKSAGSFKIDHPLDPANKYLYHSFVESPDMMNIYNGNVTTDAKGEAVVVLPDWFEVLNKDFRYQLTPIGQFAQATVSSKVKGNRFTIKTDKPNVEVSWQLTGIRKDAYAEANRIPVEEVKPPGEQGTYLHPELYGQPDSKSVYYERKKPEQPPQPTDLTP